MTVAIEADHRQLLRRLADDNSSGCLEVNSEKVSWKIYLNLGELVYAHCSVQSLDQLKYHLHHYGWQEAISAVNQLPKSFLNKQSLKEDKYAEGIYGKVIPWLMFQKHLNESQVSKLIQNISQDDLFSCLCLESGSISWQKNSSFPDWISTRPKSSLPLKLCKCLNEAEIKQKQWQDCSPKLSSTHQRPYFPPSWQEQPLPASGSLDLKTLTQLTQILKGGTSIRQLSILLKKDELQVAKILSPYIDERLIYLHHAQAPLEKLPGIPRNIHLTSEKSSKNGNNNEIKPVNTMKTSVKILKIVCIDDSPTILNEIQRFLDQERFEITAIVDPVQAVSKIFSINPDLILLDITMPRINGYKLCGLLRSSGKCDLTPIIMVTGNTGLIDKARAKIAGATDYLAKPFSKEGLNKIVVKHLQ